MGLGCGFLQGRKTESSLPWQAEFGPLRVAQVNRLDFECFDLLGQVGGEMAQHIQASAQPFIR
jgi:hypothetical protein